MSGVDSTLSPWSLGWTRAENPGTQEASKGLTTPVPSGGGKGDILHFLPQSTAREVIWLSSLGWDWVLWHKGTPHSLGQTLKPTKSCCSEAQKS